MQEGLLILLLGNKTMVSSYYPYKDEAIEIGFDEGGIIRQAVLVQTAPSGFY